MKKTPLALILAAWVAVAVPLGWGLYTSVIKSRPLFTGEAVDVGRPAGK